MAPYDHAWRPQNDMYLLLACHDFSAIGALLYERLSLLFTCFFLLSTKIKQNILKLNVNISMQRSRGEVPLRRELSFFSVNLAIERKIIFSAK